MVEARVMSDVDRWAQEKRQEVDAGQILYTKNEYNGTHKTTDGGNKLVFKAQGGWWHYPSAGSTSGYTWYRKHNAQTTPSVV